MATNYLYRLLIVVPAARVAALNTWVAANLDPTGSDWFTANLSASGTAPATHAWANAGLTASDIKAILAKLAQMMSASLPANWDSRTRAQQKQWVIDNRAAIQTALGIWVEPMDNDGTWSDPSDTLATLGLQVIQP